MMEMQPSLLLLLKYWVTPVIGNALTIGQNFEDKPSLPVGTFSKNALQ